MVQSNFSRLNVIYIIIFIYLSGGGRTAKEVFHKKSDEKFLPRKVAQPTAPPTFSYTKISNKLEKTTKEMHYFTHLLFFNWLLVFL